MLNLGDDLAPGGWRQKRQQAFNNQGQSQASAQDQPRGVAFQKITAKSNGQGYFLAGAAAAGALPLKALKNSLLAGSSTITSPFLLKLALLASKLR